jgi:hypothetical protein
MRESQITLPGLAFKAIVAHTVTYLIIGLLAFSVFHYSEDFAGQTWMRQTNDPIVALGVALQPIRGVLFALAFYPLREILFGRKNGWLVTWLLLVTLGIFSIYGEAPGSVEGAIYLTLPVREQFLTGGMLEVLSQSLLFSGVLYYWVNHPEKRWINWVLGVLFVLAVLTSLMGYLVASGAVTLPV